MEPLSSKKTQLSLPFFQTPLGELDLPSAICLKQEDQFQKAAQLMQERNFGSVPLIDEANGALCGIVTERDILFQFPPNQLELDAPLSQLIKFRPCSMKETDTLGQCLKLMSLRKVRYMPIVDDQMRPIKVISARDIVKGVVQLLKEEMEDLSELMKVRGLPLPLENEEGHLLQMERVGRSSSPLYFPLHFLLSTPNVHQNVHLSLGEVLSFMQSRKIGAVLLMDLEVDLKGIFTERDFLTKVLDKVDWQERLPVKEFMTPFPRTLQENHFVFYAIHHMFYGNFRNIPVVNEMKYPLGIVTMGDIISYLTRSFLS